MKSLVLTLDRSEEWRETLQRYFQADIYFLPEYHEVYERNGEGRANAFVVQDAEKVFFYPFMVRPITSVAKHPLPTLWFDIETVYGYSGPLSNVMDAAFWSQARSVFHEWCVQERIIAEFIRFSPLLENHVVVDKLCAVSFDRETVVVDLQSAPEDLWHGYSSSHRRKIRQAQRMGLVCDEVPLHEGLDCFKELYIQTMTHVRAAPYYFFSDTYFESLEHLLGDRSRLFVVRDGNLIVASAMFFWYDGILHYHLGARCCEYTKTTPNALLFHAVALWGHHRGFRYLHLGGGRTSRQDDDLLRFKASISKQRRHYYTGRTIHNPPVYEELCSRWLRYADVAVRPNYFLLYRAEIP